MKHSNRSPFSDLLAQEQGTIRREAGVGIALGYPAPYGVGVSSLGAQTVYRAWNDVPGVACTRFFMPEKGSGKRPLVSVETRRPVSQAAAIAFSVACETDLYGVVELLDAAGIQPLRAHRADTDPPVIVGGPLTLLDPHLVGPLSDIVVVGESEQALPLIGEALAASTGRRELEVALSGSGNGIWVPVCRQEPPQPAEAPMALLPAFAATWSSQAEFKDLFLVEVARGCKRGCTFCVMSSRTVCAKRFRPVPIEKILQVIPSEAKGVGLVGAAVTDHPDIEALVGHIVDTGRRVSLSSVRADRLTPNLVQTLKRGGLRTLTVAADGSSDRLRKLLHKGIGADDLIRAAQLAKAATIRGVKLYSMVGLPGESDEDLKEFSDLIVAMSRHVRIAVAVQAFVPKPGTPLAGSAMPEIGEINRRLGLIKRGVKGRARFMSTSPRWSWVDWKMAHAGERAASIAIAARELGGNFSAWRKAISRILAEEF
ncbi:MAG: radical SAM protein [Proteobacteria bacterium]|nr:radical SAM protein [Pseudomonadota bacterium]